MAAGPFNNTHIKEYKNEIRERERERKKKKKN